MESNLPNPEKGASAKASAVTGHRPAPELELTVAEPPEASIREIEAEIEYFEDLVRTKPVFAEIYNDCIERLNEWLDQAIEERDNLLR